MAGRRSRLKLGCTWDPPYASLSSRLKQSNKLYVAGDSDGNAEETDNSARGSWWTRGRAVDGEEALQLDGAENVSHQGTDMLAGSGEDGDTQQSELAGMPVMVWIAQEAPVWCYSNVPSLMLKVSCLSAFHCVAPKRAAEFELLSILVPSLRPGVARLGGVVGIPQLPRPLRCLKFVMGGLSAFTLPVCIFLGTRLLFRLFSRGGRGRHQEAERRQVSGQRTRELRLPAQGDTPHPSELLELVAENNPGTAFQYSQIFAPYLKNMKAMLDWEQLHQCPRFAYRFDDTEAELMRYAWTTGLVDATTREEADEALHAAAARAESTLSWTRAFSFYSPKELRRSWEHLVKWARRTSSGHPVLLIRLGQALEECVDEEANLFGAAVISQVDRGVRKLLDNRGIDQIISVVDCGDIGLLQVKRLLALIEGIPVTLNKHYPGRLKEVYLVRVPPLLRWVVQAVKPFLHPKTRSKIHVCGANLSSLPRDLREVLETSRTAAAAAAAAQMSPCLTPEVGVSSSSTARGLPQIPTNTSTLKDGRIDVDSTSTLLSGTLLWVLFLCVFYYFMLHFIKVPDSVEQAEDDL